jgi:hypothetical protein
VILGLWSLPPERLKYASGLFNMMRNLGGAVGIAVSGAILNAQTNFHFNTIASHLTPADGPMERLIAGLAQRYGAIPGSLGAGHVAALEAALAARLPRSFDPRLCGRLSRDHARLRRRHVARAFDAPGRPAALRADRRLAGRERRLRRCGDAIPAAHSAAVSRRLASRRQASRPDAARFFTVC